MNFKNISLILAILLISVIAIGSVSAAEDVAFDNVYVSDLGVTEINDIGVLSDSKSITVNEENVNTYFDIYGLTEEVSEGDTLNLEGNFSDFTFNINKNNIVINGLEGNKLTNCVIMGAEPVEGLTISNLNFEITEIRNAISLTSPVDTKILNNTIVVNYGEDIYIDGVYSLEAIIVWAGGENLIISGNNISMESKEASMYIYAIDLADCSSDWMTGGNHFSYVISDNNVYAYSENTCPYGLYLAGVTGSEDNPFIVKNNVFDIVTNSSDSDVYGIAISGDSWCAPEDSEYIFVEDNVISVSGNNMVYGIEVYAANNLKFVNNTINAYSTAGAYCIGVARINGFEIYNNVLDVKGGDYSSVYTSDYVGAGLAPIYTGSSSSVVTENNTFVINEDIYNLFFNNEGKLTDLVNDGDVLIFNMVLNNKDLTIDKAITLDGNGIGAIIGGTLYIEGENIKVSNLLINNINKNGILVKEGSSDVEISNNSVIIVGVNAGAYDSYMAIATIGGVGNIKIMDNAISILGNAPYNYAIDICDSDPVTYVAASYNPTGIEISGNNINMNVANLAEAIYTSIACNTLVKDNFINIVSTGYEDIYAIAASIPWGPGLDNPNNVTVSNNEIHATGNNMVFGIELFGSDLTINDNTINIKSNGGAYAIGIANADDVLVNNNKIDVKAVTKDVSSWDAIGAGVGGIILKTVSNANVNANNIAVTSQDKSASGVVGTDCNSVSVKSNNIVADSKKGNLAVNVPGASVSGNTPKTASTITASSLTKYYGDSKKLTITLKDENGNVLANKKVTITIKGKTYTATTNSNGQASFAISNAKGSYSVAIKFAGDDNYVASSKTVTVKVVAPVIKAVSTKVKKGKYLQISFKTYDNKVIKNTKVTIKINGKTYTVTTNSKGIASLKLNLKKKTYTVKAAFKSTATYGKTTKSFKVKVI